MPSTQKIQAFPPSPRRNIGMMLVFLTTALLIYLLMIKVAPQFHTSLWLFLLVWGASFLCYLGACSWVLKTKTASGRWYWAELGLIFLGALVFRAMLLPLSPGLSGDAWRYLWDGRVIMHGYNPYLYTPLDKALLSLRDSVFTQSNYTDAPTKYPPGAELFYTLGYLLTPGSLLGMKALFVLCDLITSGTLAVVLMMKKLDPRRVVIYTWCPLPIVEYAIEGHIDVVAITFTVLAVACMLSSWRSARSIAGVCLGIATLVKLYPIVLLIVVVRRRDWGLLVACILMISAGYLPFLLLSQGHPLTVIFALSNQADEHRGVLQIVMFGLGQNLGLNVLFIRLAVAGLVLAIAGTTLLMVLIRRMRGRIRVEMAVLIVIVMLLSLYAHIFPWYACAFLPWIVLLAEPLRTACGWNARGIALALCWYLACVVIFSYIPGLVEFSTPLNWAIYYSASFGVVLVGLAIAAIVHSKQ